MKNLTSMVAFVLEQVRLLKNGSINILQFINRIGDFALFLSQKLELWMFVPCDEDGNVLEVPKEPKYNSFANDWIHEQYRAKVAKYQQAKERCLFEGFEVEEKREKTAWITNGDFSIQWSFVENCFFYSYNRRPRKIQPNTSRHGSKNDWIMKSNKQETIFEMEYRLRQEAKELVKNHIDNKPIKYLIK